MFNKEDYEHIKENTFNPRICPECARISVKLESTPEILSDMYEALKGMVGCFRNIEIVSSIQDDTERHLLGLAVEDMAKALAKAEV